MHREDSVAEPAIDSRAAFRVVGIQVRAGTAGVNPPEA
jgi:hypothetical protein